MTPLVYSCIIAACILTSLATTCFVCFHFAYIAALATRPVYSAVVELDDHTWPAPTNVTVVTHPDGGYALGRS